MARTTIGNVIERVRRQLASSLRYEVNVLGAALTASATDTTVQLSYALSAGLREGAVLSVGREDLRVMSVDRNAMTAEVIRGWQDSEAVAHSLGDEVWVNPRFSQVDIAEALADEILAWGRDLYRVADDTFTIADSAETYELPVAWAGAWGVVDVLRNWTVEDTSAWPRIPVKLIRGTTSSGGTYEFDGATTSGLLLRFTDRVLAGKIHVTVALPFDLSDLSDSIDLVDDVGLQPSMLDVLTLGMKQRLIGDAEHSRHSRMTQDEPRRAEEVPPNAALQDSAQTFVAYMRRRGEEANRLRALYPLRMT